MTKIANRSVLITGGAAGIGKLIAGKCLKEGAYKVILWDINEANLQETAAYFASKGYDVMTDVVDVADVNDIVRAAEALKENIGTIDILFNNAGIVVGKSFDKHSHRDISKTIDINVSGVMHVALEFLPGMIDQNEGHIINIASAAGLIPNPNMSVYAASKWAVVGWSESLRLEQEENNTGVKVTTVMPSYINTGMFDGVKSPVLTPIMEPEFIVEKIMQAVKNDEIVLMEPFMTKTIPLLRGILPTRAFDFIAGKIFGVYKTMDNFKGKPQQDAVPDKDKLKADQTKVSKKTTVKKEDKENFERI
jgi:all-trans-retinol dehydrogenase (NAD+)